MKTELKNPSANPDDEAWEAWANKNQQPPADPTPFPLIEIGEDSRYFYVSIIAANEIQFRVEHTRQTFDALLNAICRAAPAMVRVDGDLAEYYDGNLDRKPAEEDLKIIQELKAMVSRQPEAVEAIETYFHYA